MIVAFGRRLRELRTAQPNPRRPTTMQVGTRKAAYMPKSLAAERAGLDDSYWGRLEQGRCDPTLTSLLRIQRAFGLDSIETLLGPTASAGFARSLEGTGPSPAGDAP